ncbi:DNA polymerase III subunit delta [Treponema parvum]|uniref:DNA polymerase III subunit delta n=1 Tax=Treponema parvum TaxID=138851 RepID=UPI001AEC61F0|nr:DNA polymerase III subunit delta [Treponema parvum]QTQ15573.1 DNA polymerase III subunit delta [Treponema parvum]
MTPSVYLYTGPEFGERNAAVDSVKSALKKKYGAQSSAALPEKNSSPIDEYLYYASETDFSEVLTTLQSSSLFVPASCVVLREAELLKNKRDIDLLSSWAASSSGENSVLILVSDEISIDAKVEKLIPKTNRKIFWEMFEDQKREWLEKFFLKSGYKLESEAAETILDLVENNTEALKNECSRFFLCLPQGKEVTVSDVENILAHNREESAFTLFDAMADFKLRPENRFENALLILQKIRLSKGFSSVMLIAGLVSCFRRLSLWHSLHSNGAFPDDFTLKTKGFTSKKARTQYACASKVWTSGQTTAIIALLAASDVSIRASGAQFEETELQMMLYAIIMKGGSFCSVYEF